VERNRREPHAPSSLVAIVMFFSDLTIGTGIASIRPGGNENENETDRNLDAGR
jgi:hypothetical protein